MAARPTRRPPAPAASESPAEPAWRGPIRVPSTLSPEQRAIQAVAWRRLWDRLLREPDEHRIAS